LVKSNHGDNTMASIRNDVPLHASACGSLGALRDFGAVHQRLYRIVTDCRLDGDARVVTFVSRSASASRPRLRRIALIAGANSFGSRSITQTSVLERTRSSTGLE